MKKKLLTLLLVSTISIGSLSMPLADQALAAGSAQIVQSVSFRVSPNVSADRIRYLKPGETVAILDKVNSYWYQVKDKNGRTGYVSTASKYITTNDQQDHGGTVPTVPASEKAQKVIAAGKTYLGTPYEFGSSRMDTRTFDCSDFVRQSFLDGVGVKLPTDSRSQGDYVKSKGQSKTNWRDLKPGDIMFFMEYRGYRTSDYAGVDKSTQRITHDGIYLGDGKVLHTYSSSSGGVRIDTIEGKSWEYRFLYGGTAF